MTIIATGFYRGVEETISFIFSDGNVTVDNKDLEELVNDYMIDPPAMGGTFWPEPSSKLALFSVIENCVFDKPPSNIVVEGQMPELPSLKGRIY